MASKRKLNLLGTSGSSNWRPNSRHMSPPPERSGTQPPKTMKIENAASPSSEYSTAENTPPTTQLVVIETVLENEIREKLFLTTSKDNISQISNSSEKKQVSPVSDSKVQLRNDDTEDMSE